MDDEFSLFPQTLLRCPQTGVIAAPTAAALQDRRLTAVQGHQRLSAGEGREGRQIPLLGVERSMDGCGAYTMI